MYKHRFTQLSQFTIAAAALVGLSISGATIAKAEIAIGLMSDLSGKASLLGRNIELGARLASNEHKSGTGAENIRLFIQNSACNAKQAQKAAAKLLRLNIKIVIGPICNKALFAAIKVLSPAGITIITPNIRATRIARGRKKQNWLVYSLAGNAKTESQAISKILLDRWQGMAYAIADDGSIYGRGLADDFRTLAELSGQKPVAVANYRPLQTKQISMLRRLQKSGMEALFIGGDAVDIAQIARDAEKIGLDIEIAGGETVALLPFEEGAPLVPPGLLAVMPVEPLYLPAAAGLVNSLKRQGIAPDGGVIPGYALMQIAIKAAGSSKNIDQIEFDTVLGKIRFSNEGYANAYPYRLHVWADGEIKPLGGF